MKVSSNYIETLGKNLGIDFSNYHTKEISAALNNLVNTPYKVVLHFIFWPLLFMLIICLTGVFLIWPLSWGGAILWILTGLLIGPLCGVSVATYLVVASLDKSSLKLYETTLDIVDNISDDLKQNAQNVPLNFELPNYKELLRLVKLSFVIPALKELMIKKLWPLGNWIGNIVVNYLKKVSQKSEHLIKSDQIELKTEGVEQVMKYAEIISENTEILRKNLNIAHKVATNLTLSPLRFTMLMALLLNIVVLLLIFFFYV